jgi:hypothetical protein
MPLEQLDDNVSGIEGFSRERTRQTLVATVTKLASLPLNSDDVVTYHRSLGIISMCQDALSVYELGVTGYGGNPPYQLFPLDNRGDL